MLLKSGLMVTMAGAGSATSGEDVAEQVALSAEPVTRDCSYLIVAAVSHGIYEQGHITRSDCLTQSDVQRRRVCVIVTKR